MTVSIIDISHYQGTPDFNAVRAAGVALVFLKVTQGTGYTDPTFTTNRDHARAAGLRCGFYHFAAATNPVSEANYFVDNVGSLQAGDLVALDWETTAPDPVSWSLTFLKQVEARLGVKPLIYLNKSTVGAFNWDSVVANNNGLWIANYDYNRDNPAPALPHWPVVAIEQYSDKGTVSGVAGQVDLDVFFGDVNALGKYGYGGGVAPAPAPAPTPAPAPAPSFDPNSLPTMAYGQTGHAIADLQRFLNAYNWRPVLPLLPVTGYFGPGTASVLHAAGRQLGVQGDVDGKNFGPHFKAAFARIGFRG